MADFNPTGLDAYKPADITVLVENAGVAKARLPFVRMCTLGVLAGAFIALGAAVYTFVMTGVDPSFGPARLLGGVAFSLGLILVIVGGAELFTGNALMVMAAVDGRISARELMRSWVIVYFANFAGALVVVLAVWTSGILAGPAGATAMAIAEGKAALAPFEAFMRGALCNVLVCLAVWLTLAARTVTGKILAIIWPIAGFVVLGLEHSVANMYLIPLGMLIGADVGADAFLANLLFVTAGNVVGGAGGVALAYRLAYGAGSKQAGQR